jgi:methylmalonyl-CoA mutase N-terminal domain/subunit
MTINATAIILLALYVAVRRRQGRAACALSGTVQNDILKEYVARGTYIYPPRPSLRIVTDIIAFCERELPQWNTISISGYHIARRDRPPSRRSRSRSRTRPPTFSPPSTRDSTSTRSAQRISFFFNAHNDFLEEIAKFRAARRLWARRDGGRFAATNPRAQQLRFHTRQPAVR